MRQDRDRVKSLAAVTINVALEIVSPASGSFHSSQSPAIDSTDPSAALMK
jgi:hypothetical protein